MRRSPEQFMSKRDIGGESDKSSKPEKPEGDIEKEESGELGVEKALGREYTFLEKFRGNARKVVEAFILMSILAGAPQIVKNVEAQEDPEDKKEQVDKAFGEYQNMVDQISNEYGEEINKISEEYEKEADQIIKDSQRDTDQTNQEGRVDTSEKEMSIKDRVNDFLIKISDPPDNPKAMNEVHNKMLKESAVKGALKIFAGELGYEKVSGEKLGDSFNVEVGPKEIKEGLQEIWDNADEFVDQEFGDGDGKAETDEWVEFMQTDNPYLKKLMEMKRFYGEYSIVSPEKFK